MRRFLAKSMQVASVLLVAAGWVEAQDYLARVQPGTLAVKSPSDQSADPDSSSAASQGTATTPAAGTETLATQATTIGAWSRVQVYTVLGMGVLPEGPYKPLTGRERKVLYLKDTFLSPHAYIIPWVDAYPTHFANIPPEWTGFSGYAKRAGARFVHQTVRNSVAHSMMALLKHEPRYVPCRCDGGFWKRFGHAVLFSYVTINEDGKKVPHISRFIANYSGELASAATYPGPYDVWQPMRRGTGMFIWGWWLNAIREFRPEIGRFLGISK